MKTNEVEALTKSIEHLAARKSALNPPIWIELVKGIWEIGSANEPVVRIDSESGEVYSDTQCLSPVDALSVARTYAVSNNLSWKPGFTLSVELGCWNVGACQSQLGGQLNIYVSHEGEVIKHRVNPK
ncbi:MAG: hypothetical protein N0C88_17245 [Candidatus Thiodiazotropha lotti]|uniref:Uncharacterized protein n=1 Tax=Candidatus Thiodiazotropha lotti TaxID=2792787 RepID=A0A9E4N145_9GAMM|nr:hypothetical protein [Candidatus Thiodiazotropha lotti]MCW4205049.1 hypothetical protein [Candidatus Thiodiazotropha lotti]